MSDQGAVEARASTGVPGLDEILHGGLIAGRNYLVRGGPGSGKTTLGVHFLRVGEPANNLFVTLGETAEQLRDNAHRSGLPLDVVPILDASPVDAEGGSEQAYNLLESWEVEGGTVHDRIVEYARNHAPQRVFIDSLTQLRYLTPDGYQFRKQVLSLLRQLTANGATVMFTSEIGAAGSDDDLQFLADGVIQLTRTDGGRVCTVSKMRGSGFFEGGHHYAVGDGGMVIYPRLVPEEHNRAFAQESIGSGIAAVDKLTGGGIERGTVTVLSGPSGVGKSTFGAHFMQEAAKRGERSVIYGFDEGRATFEHRLARIGMPIQEMLESGALAFEYIEPMSYNPDRFALLVRDAVERRGVRVVMLDSLSGYRQSIPGKEMGTRIHELTRYLVNMGVTVILVNEVKSIVAQEPRATDDGVSYLADTIILLRYMEAEGELRKSVGVLKKRTSDFEKSVRAFDITEDGIRVGEPMRGVLGGAGGGADRFAPAGAGHGVD